MQIRFRLTLQFTLVVFFFLALSFGLVYFFMHQYNQQQFHQRLDDKAVTSATLLLRIDEVDSSLLKVIDRAKHDVLFNENITVYDSADQEIYTNNDTINFALTPETMQEIRRSGRYYFHYHGFEVSGILFHNKHSEYVVVAGAMNVRGDRLMANLRVLLLALLSVTMIIVAFAGWVYAGRALKPINSLIGEIQSISEQDLHKRLKERIPNDEIGKLIRIFNGLLARIDKAFDLQRSFVSNVSHELKNPLTKITSQLEVTLLNTRSDDEYRKTMESVLEDTRELNMLSSSLLDLASVNDENRTFAVTRLRLDEILWEVLEKTKSQNPGYQTEIVTLELPDQEERLCVYGNPYLLQTALSNIVENACKFSTDQTARVSLVCSEREIHVRVSDQGPGIEAAELENIFEPFHRADRTSRTKGYGIGLSLSQRIIKLYNGTVDVKSSLGVGTDVTVNLKAIVAF